MRFWFQPPNPFRNLTHKLEALVRGKLWLQALVGLGLGLGLGIMLGPDVGYADPEDVAVLTSWLALPGELFLRLIKMILIPLLVASIIRGLGATSDIQKLRRVGLLFFAYIVCTTIVACVIGIGVATLIQPGQYVQIENIPADVDQASPLPPATINIAQDLPAAFVNLIPENPLASAMQGEMLGIVIFSIIIGIALAMRHNEKIKPLLGIMDAILDVCMTIVKWALWLVPLAVFGLMARMASQVGISTLLGMGVYVLSVLLGLLILFVFYLFIVTVFGRIHPLRFIRAAGPVQLLAFSTSSSTPVMPLSIKTAEEELDVDQDVAEVVVPLGATMNMDGTALYQSVAILFLAQMSGIELMISQQVMIVLTLVLSSIGAPATPGVGMVILGTVAANFGIPTAGLILIVGVDRILDMSRTALNVTGDLTACVILGHKERHGLFGWLKRRRSI